MKIRSINLRLISVLTALMLVLSCFPAFINSTGKVSALDPVEIKTFKTGLADGAEKQDDDKYVWTPLTFNKGHKFIYYINFTLAGKDFFTPGEIRITFPKRLLKDRDNNYADELELSVPSQEEVESMGDDFSEGDNQFSYVEDGDNIVITNFRKFSSASTGYIELAYVTSETTYEYRDMSPSDTFSADIELLDSNETPITSEHSEAVPVYINTTAELKYTTKRCLNLISPYTSWGGWGRAPENDSDYYYLMWELVSGMNLPTQPYDIEIDDNITEGFGEPVAYKFAGESVFTQRNKRTSVRYATESGLRYDYVITKHLKSECDRLQEYIIKNEETMTLTPIDLLDDETSASAEATFRYYRRPFSAPGNYIWSEKRGNNNWWTPWPYADYGLQDLKYGSESGGVDHLSGNIKFYVGTSAYVFPLTFDNSGSIEDINSYGKRNVKFSVTDDSFYLNSTFEYNENRITILPEHRKLTSEDFCLEYINYTFRLQDAKKDTENNSFVGVNAQPNENDILRFYFRFNDGDWTEAAQYNMYTGEATFNDEYILQVTNDKVVFKEGSNCTGYRIEAENAHYSTQISATPYCRIKRSDYVLEQSEGINKITLTNISNFTVTDSNGREAYNRDTIAEDYIIGVEKESTIEKQVAFTRNNNLKRYVTIGWQVKISEHYMSNEGLKYVPQESGVFYDLLPIGTDLDESSIRVGIDYGDFLINVNWLEENDYEFSRENNYKNTGRTLLIVRIKTGFNRAVVTYNTVYTWDSSMDYGSSLMNTVAYETGNDRIANGYQDDGGEIEDKEIMSGLDKTTSGWKFIYEQKRHPIRFLVSTRTGLTKAVSTDKSFDKKLETTVRQGANYKYTLRYATTIFTKAADMVIYDSLENYSDDDVSSDWYGTLQSVNLEQPKLLGIAPVLYLSAKDGLDISVYHDVDNDMINGEKVWLRAEEFAERYGDPDNAPEGGYDLSKAKAVAFDLRYDENDERYIMPFNSSVSVELYMKAAERDSSNKPDPTTYNNVFIKGSVIDILGNEDDEFIHHDFTSVHLRICGDLPILKHEADREDVLIKNIGFTLTGTSVYGTVYDNRIRYTDNDGRLVFEDIEKGEYTLAEADGSVDYLPLGGTLNVVIDESGRTWVGNRLLDKDEYYHISNEPRVHTDIEFTKKDLLKRNSKLQGARFMLQGESVYYPGEIYIDRAESGEDGVVRFENVEWGTYTLTEEEAPSDHIKLKGVEYDVYVDGDGNFSIRAQQGDERAEQFLEGQSPYYTIYNEPYHRLTLVKSGLTGGSNVVGAKFRLYGMSKSDTWYDEEKETNDRGIVEFSKLEAGNYTLVETYAPTGFVLDDTKRIVTITAEGIITIDGLTQDSQNRFVLTNKEDGTITIIKKWVDNETTASRIAKGIKPLITLSSEHAPSEATFKNGNSLRTDMLNLTKASSSDSTHVDKILAFKQYTKIDGKRVVAERIANGTAVKVDDDTTNNVIYIWLVKDENAPDYGTIYWWSDAKDVFFPKDSSNIFKSFTNMAVFDTYGINFSRVTNMSYMFNGCGIEYVDFSDADLSKVTNMSYMFQSSGIKNADFSGKDLSALTTAEKMFYYCAQLETINFSEAIIPNLKNMYYFCFFNAYSTESQLTLVDFSNTNLSSLTNLQSAFGNNGKLNKIDFSGCTFGTKAINMMNLTNEGWVLKSSWGLKEISFENITGTIHVSNLQCAFMCCKNLETLDLSHFDTSACTTLYGTFANCTNLTRLDLTSFDTSNVTNMASMFGFTSNGGCSSLKTIDLTSFDTSNVTTMQQMFYGCSSLEEIFVDNDIFDTSIVTDMSNMFYGCKMLEDSDIINLQLDISSCTNMSYMFAGCSMITEAVIGGQEGILREQSLPNIKNMSYMFSSSGVVNVDFSGKELEALTSVEGMFKYCYELKTINFSGAILPKLNNMKYFCFYNSYSNDSQLTSVDFSNADLRALKTMQSAFGNNGILQKIDLSGCIFGTQAVDMTNLTNEGWILKSCFGLKEISFENIKNAVEENGSISIIENGTIHVSSLYYTFMGCKNLVTLDLSNFDTSACTSMYGTFANCIRLTSLALTNFDTSNVTTMACMFGDRNSGGCSSLKTLDLTSFDTSSVTDMQQMFYGCTSLETVVVSNDWTTAAVTSSNQMFTGCTSITGKCGTQFDSTKTNAEYARVDTTDLPGYFTDTLTTGSGRRTFTLFTTSSSTEAITFTSDDAEHCTVTYIDDNTWEYTFTGIDASLNYYAWEDVIENYTPDYKGYVEVVSNKATITNYADDAELPVFGNLSIQKQLDAQEGAALTEDELANMRFTFSVLLTDENDQPLSGSKIIGSLVFTDGVTRFPLKGGESITITNIPAGYHYKVTELEAEGYETAVQGDAEGVILADETINVVFTNTKIYVEEYQATFTLQKLVDGNGDPDKDEYSYLVYLEGLHKNALYTLSNGDTFRAEDETATVPVKLKNGESVVFTVPHNSSVQITELGGSDYSSAYQLTVNGIQKKHGTASQGNDLTTSRFVADKDNNTIVTYTNTRNVRQNLTLKKTVSNGSPDNDDVFSFDIRLFGLAPEERVYFNYGSERADADGIFTLDDFGMKAGETLIFYSLPAGAKYRIVEKSSDYIASYRLVDANGVNVFAQASDANEERKIPLSTQLETIDEGEDVTVEFINTKVTHDVTVTKTIDGNGFLTTSEYRSKSFGFKVVLSGLESNKEYTVYSFSTVNSVLSEHEESFTSLSDGQAEYEAFLRDGEKFTIKDLPENAAYTITESGDKNYTASFTVSANTGAVIELTSKSNSAPDTDLSTATETVDPDDTEICFNFTNTYVPPSYVLPAAGMEDRRMAVYAAFGGMILFAALYWFVNKKRKSCAEVGD